MTMPVRFAVTVLLAGFLLTSFAFASQPTLQISLSPEDPDLRSGARPDEGPVEFFLFATGDSIRGVQFGIHVSGGEFVDYRINSRAGWLALPKADAYPGTIMQAVSQCVETPIFLGSMTVLPSGEGEPVTLNVIPDLMGEVAGFLRCDYSVTEGIFASPAVYGGDAPDAYHVIGESVPVTPGVETRRAMGMDDNAASGQSAKKKGKAGKRREKRPDKDEDDEDDDDEDDEDADPGESADHDSSD
ncbi:MAG: hypothetical protein QF819_03040 [Gemmatimonadota bacterium]|jgi:hypothetical protein|nr:hypothetical protein [Gemmatimonadota bacterium]MDP7032070.1 hypothetical protein [Gemmatimonadota bacterium]